MFFLSCVCYAFARVCLYMCLVVTCWERADLLALVCGVCHVPIGILGQVKHLIVSIPDLCTLTYFNAIKLINLICGRSETTWFVINDACL